MACIYKSVTNPENDSLLYQQLSNTFATEEEVQNWFAFTQTQEFKDVFGDWEADYSKEVKEIDPDAINELTGEPKVKRDRLGQYYFQAKDGSKIRLNRQVLNFDHTIRKSLVDTTLMQLFGDNLVANAEIIEDVDINSIFTDQSEGSIYQILNGNVVDLRDVKQLVIKRLNSMKIRIVNDVEEAYNPEDDLTLSEVEDIKALDLRQPFEKNSKDNASANIKFLLSFIPEMQFNEDGSITQLTRGIDMGNDEVFSYNSYYPFDQIWNKFESSLAGMVDLYDNGVVTSLFNRMLNKLNEDYKDDASIIYAINEIRNLSEYKQVEFVQAFYKDKIKFITTTFKKTGQGIQFKYFRSDAAVTPSKRIVSEWNANFKKSRLIKDNSFNQNRAKLVNQNYKKFLQELRISSNNTTPAYDNMERLTNFLNEVGIYINDETLSAATYIFHTEGEHYGENFNNYLFQVADKVKYIFSGVSKLNNKQVVDKGEIKDVLTTKEASGQVNWLADIESKFRKDLAENTVMGAEGKKYWIYTMPSFISNKLKRLKQDTLSELPSNDGFYKNSLVLNKFRERIDNPGYHEDFYNNFDIITFNNLREEGVADVGTDNQGIEKADQFTDMINKALMGTIEEGNSAFYTLTPADKGRIHHIVGTDFFENVQGESIGQLNEQTVDIFTNYFLDELHRIENEYKLITDEEYRKNNPDKLYNHYHFKLKGNTPVYFDENGNPVGNAFKIHLFPNLSPFNKGKLSFISDIFDSKNGIITQSDEAIRANSDLRNLINDELQLTIGLNHQDLRNTKVIRTDEKSGQEVFTGLDHRIMSKYMNISNGNTEVAISRAVSDFVINAMINNIEYTKVFTGDYAFFKNLPDFSKRIPGTYTDGIQLALKEGDNANFNLAVLPNVEIPSNSIEEIKAHSPALARAYSKVNATDAQGYITLDRWKFVMERSNHWNPRFEEAYQRIEAGNPTTEDYKYAAQPVKGVHYEVTNGVPTYIKYSAAVLIPSVIEGTSLQRLNDAMIAQGVDEAVVVDGVKVGATVPSDAINTDGKLVDDIKLNSIRLRNNNYKIQQDLRPKGVKKTLLGSQIKKTILTDIKLDQMYGQYTGQQVVDQTMDILSDLSNKGLDKLLSDAGVDAEGNVVDREKLTYEIIQSLSERNASENLIEALSKGYDYDYVANYRQKIQNTLQSIINNSTVKVKTNGASFIQMSSWGMDTIEAKERGVKLLVDNFDHLKAPIVVDGKVKPGQVFVTSNYISKFIPNWKSLTPKQLKDKLDPKLLKMIGYRIPNQGMSSNDSLEIVGILPESMGDTIIPYVDITKKTGSDFDIDKMYVMIPNAKPRYNKKTQGEIISELMQLDEEDLINIIRDNSTVSREYIQSLTSGKKAKENLANEIVLNGYFSAEQLKLKPVVDKLEYVTFNPNKPANEQSQDAVENRLIELMQVILEDEKTYDKLMSPLDSDLLKDDINELHGDEEAGDIGNNFFSPAYQLQKKFDNAGGKSGVGLTANQLVDHMWTQIKDVKFTEDLGFVNKSDGYTSFAGEYDVLGEHRISDTLSWFLTAYVDIAKDPYISKGNHNQYTSNTVFMLLRAGTPIKFVNRLVGQDIIKEMASISSLRKSRMKIRDFRHFRPLKDAAIEELKNKYNIVGDVKYDTFDEVLERFNKIEDKDKRKEALLKYQDRLEKDLKTKTKDGNLQWFNRQLEYLDLWEYYHKVGEDFAQTVLSSKQDVNGGGKDFISAYVNKNRVQKAKELGFINYEAKFNDTFLGTAYKNSTQLGIKVMEQLFVTSNFTAQQLYDNVSELINPKNDVLVNEDLGFELEKSYFAHILGQTGFNLPNEYIKNMFMGENTVYDNLLRLRQLPELENNYFLNKLDVQTKKGIKFIKMDSTRNNSEEALNEISRSWQELFESENEEVRQLARDLVYYSFYNSGFRTNISSFFDHIPHEQLKDMVEEGIEDAKLNYSGGFMGITQFVDKFFRNNWNDDSLVPRVKSNFKKLSSGNLSTRVLVVEAGDKGTEYGKFTRPYVKVSKTTMTGLEEVTTIGLFKNIGYSTDDKGKITQSYFVRVPKLGFTEAGNNIVEYSGNIDVDGDSSIESNNLTENYKKQADLTRRIVDEIDSILPYESILDTARKLDKVSKTTNNRNQSNDLSNGLNDGLVETQCD